MERGFFYGGKRRIFIISTFQICHMANLEIGKNAGENSKTTPGFTGLQS